MTGGFLSWISWGWWQGAGETVPAYGPRCAVVSMVPLRAGLVAMEARGSVEMLPVRGGLFKFVACGLVDMVATRKAKVENRTC